MQINVKLLWIKLFKDEMKWSGKNWFNEKPPHIHETIVSPILYMEYVDNKFVIIVATLIL